MEEADPQLPTTSFQVVVDSNKVSPEIPLLQTKQPQFPQFFIIPIIFFPSVVFSYVFAICLLKCNMNDYGIQLKKIFKTS